MLERLLNEELAFRHLAGGTMVDYGGQLQEQLARTQQKLLKLKRLGAGQLSVSNPDGRPLRGTGGGFVLSRTALLAVSDGHLIAAQRATRAVSDSASLLPMVE